jgi:hypothetical protein
MTIEQGLRLMSGLMTLLGTALTVFVSPWWGLLLLLVGLNNIQSAFTDTCPAVWLLSKLGLQRCGDAPAVAPGR